MSSRTTLYRRRIADRIDRLGFLVMVACASCQRRGLECRMSSLRLQCSNCTRAGIRECVPGDLPPLDFSRIDREMARLEGAVESAEAAEAEAERDEAAARSRIRSARAKLKRLRRQQHFLKEREQKMVAQGIDAVEDLERLEELEQLGREVAAVVPNDASLSDGVDWASLLSPVEGAVGSS